MRGVAVALVLVSMLVSGSAHATTQTVAVMPFKDLAGGRGDVGEAMRETVTADLRGLGLKVVERGLIDKVLAEQSLGASRADLNPVATIRIGTLVGATLMVAGAYQRSGASIRLTARFVRVETGEIVGSAKVDGDASEFLRLQDRVTTELLRSAGLDGDKVRSFAARPRPKVKMRAVELYGAAVVEADDEKKSVILHESLEADPTFSYAARDLDALEKRMRTYDTTAATEQQRAQQALEKRIAAEPDTTKRADLTMQLMIALVSTRRYRALEHVARGLEGGNATTSGGQRIAEMAGFWVVSADQQLHAHEPLLRDGERFLRAYPASTYFKAVESLMQSAIGERRRQEEGRARLATDLARLSSEQRWDLCNVAQTYARDASFVEAQRLFRACLQTSPEERLRTLRSLLQLDIEAGDWVSARRDLSLTDGMPDGAELRRSYEAQVPSDG